MARRVFLVWEHPLLRKALQALLSDAQIEWVGDSANLDDFSQLLERYEPEIVLVEEQESNPSHRAAQVLAICQQAHLRVIGINLSGNDIQYYEFDQRTITERDDLINLILKE